MGVIAIVILLLIGSLVLVVSWAESNREVKNETCDSCKVTPRPIIVTDEPKQTEVST